MLKIEVNKKYTDNKGNVREVIAIGSAYKLYSSQSNCDCLRYRILAKKKGPYPVGSEQNSTMISFKSWAKDYVA